MRLYPLAAVASLVFFTMALQMPAEASVNLVKNGQFDSGLSDWTANLTKRSAGGGFTCSGSTYASLHDTGDGRPLPSGKIYGVTPGMDAYCQPGLYQVVSIPSVCRGTSAKKVLSLNDRSKSDLGAGYTVTNSYLALCPTSSGTLTCETYYYSATLAANGTTDTGWVGYGPDDVTDEILSNSTVLLYLYTADAWGGSWHKENWWDNVTLSCDRDYIACINETGSCFMSVQDAINNASAYQTVVVVNNTYELNENVVLNVTGLRLTSNLSTKPVIWANSGIPLTISANNVAVNRLQVKYNGTSAGYSVFASSGTNITVDDSTISNSASNGASYPVYLSSVTASNIARSTISGTSEAAYGIYMTGSTSNNISSNTISATRSGGGNNGVYMAAGSTGNRIFNNSISAQGAANSFSNNGVFMTSSGSNTLDSNSVSSYGGSSNAAVYFSTSSGSNTVMRNTVSTSCNVYANTNCWSFFFNSGSGSNVLGYNTITISGRGTGNMGLYILQSASNTVANGTVTGYSDGFTPGFYVYSTSGNVISNNTIKAGSSHPTGGGGYGIHLYASSGTTIRNNTIVSGDYFGTGTNGQGSNYGVYLQSSSSSNTVSGNNITTRGDSGSNFGILSDGSNNVFSGNNVTTTAGTSSDYAIYLSGGSNNNITDSWIHSPYAYDIYDSTGATNYVINSTFNKSDIYPSTGELYVMYRVLVRPMNTSNENMPGVLLEFNDTSSVGNADNPTASFSTQSNSSGYAEVALAQFVSNSTYNLTSGYLYFNDYTIAASKTGFFGNSSTATVDSFRSLDLLLRALPVLGTLFGKGLDSYELALDSVYGDVYGYVNTVNASSGLSSGWNHIAVTFDSGSIKLYVNGVLAGSASTSATPSSNFRSLMVGNSTSARADELRFYSRALSASEVEQHYLFGSALKAILSASGAGSFGRNFNISTVTSDGSFANRHITAADLLAGTTQSINLPNATGTPSVVAVTSNSCNQRLEATKSQLQGVYC